MRRLSDSDSRRLRLLPVWCVLAAIFITWFAIGRPAPLEVAQLLPFAAALVFTSATIHFERDREGITWGLGEVAVGVAAVLADNRIGLLAVVGGMGLAYGLVKMRNSWVRACTNTAIQASAASVGLAITALPVPGLEHPAVRAMVAASTTLLIGFWAVTISLAHTQHRSLGDLCRVSIRADLMHALSVLVMAGTLGWLASFDHLSVAVAIAAGAVLLPLSTVRLRLIAQRNQAQATLHAMSELLTATDRETATKQLLAAAQHLTGDRSLRLESHIEDGPDLTCVPVPTSVAPPVYLIAESPRLTQLEGSPTRVLRMLTASAAVALDSAERQRGWKQLAETDMLTGLLNRRAFAELLEDRLLQAGSGGPRFTLAFIDANRFKEINDEFGHGVGDQVLRAIAARLRSVVRPGDACARLGGDEFCVLLLDRPDRQAAEVARGVAATVTVPLEDATVLMTCSVGSAHYPADGTTMDELFRRADERMYLAKSGYRSSAPVRSGRRAYRPSGGAVPDASVEAAAEPAVRLQA